MGMFHTVQGWPLGSFITTQSSICCDCLSNLTLSTMKWFPDLLQVQYAVCEGFLRVMLSKHVFLPWGGAHCGIFHSVRSRQTTAINVVMNSFPFNIQIAKSSEGHFLRSRYL